MFSPVKYSHDSLCCHARAARKTPCEHLPEGDKVEECRRKIACYHYTTGRYTVFYNLTPPEGSRTSYFNTFYYPSPAFHPYPPLPSLAVHGIGCEEHTFIYCITLSSSTLEWVYIHTPSTAPANSSSTITTLNNASSAYSSDSVFFMLHNMHST